ncbi:MAG: MFS transporter [Bdellovibrionales bacterium]|nr:MFS transporter [Bdellovibrionales bacterium]
MTKSLGLSDEIASLFFVIPSLCAFLSSLLIERYILSMGSILILRVGLIAMGSAFILFGLTNSFSLILVEAILFGFGFGLVSVAQNVAVSESSNSPALQRSLFSGLHSMYALASLMSPLLAGYLFRMQFNWSEIFLFSAVIPGSVLLATAFLKFNKGPELELQEQQKSESLNVSSDRQTPAAEFPLKHALFFSVAMSVYLIAEISVSSRLVVYVRRVLEVSDAVATKYLAAFFLFLFLGRLAFVFFNFAKVQTHKLMFGCLIGAGIFYSAGLLWSPWLLSVSGLFMAPFFPLVMDYAVRVFKGFSPRVIAFCMAFASLSVVFMHYGLGAMSDRVGLATALWLGPLSLVVCFVLFLVERRVFHAGAKASAS